MTAQLWYVNVFVGDFDAAVSFYRDTLGLKLNFKEDEHGYASFDTGAVGFAIARVAPDADNYKSLVGRLTGVGLSVQSLDDEHKRLASMGVDFSMPPTKQPWGGYMAMMKDPDGNELYLDQYREH